MIFNRLITVKKSQTYFCEQKATRVRFDFFCLCAISVSYNTCLSSRHGRDEFESRPYKKRSSFFLVFQLNKSLFILNIIKKSYLCIRNPQGLAKHKNGVVVQLVRIPACHAGGRGFESRPYRKRAALFRAAFLYLYFFDLRLLLANTTSSTQYFNCNLERVCEV